MSTMLRAAASILLAWATLAAADPAPPPIAAKAYIVVDLLSGQTLSAANENDRFEPASLTKLMTAYVVFEALRDGRLDPARPVTVSAVAAAADGSRTFLPAGKPASVPDLLQGMIVQSGNDAAIALAEALAGSEEAFVALMNQRAARLGLANTRFQNATGRPAPEHYASARDLATLAAALIRDFPERHPLYAQKEFTYNHIAQANRNRLLWTDPTVDGMKTGFTESGRGGARARGVQGHESGDPARLRSRHLAHAAARALRGHFRRPRDAPAVRGAACRGRESGDNETHARTRTGGGIPGRGARGGSRSGLPVAWLGHPEAPLPLTS